jgi:uncharacterized protein (DUF2236 family)
MDLDDAIAHFPAEGIFPSESPMRRVHREGVLLLGGGRALLLQIAHPLVAAGVAEHSRFREDPFGRLRRTLDAMLAIVFGRRDTAVAWAARVRRIHASVHGTLAEAAGAFARGTPYDARDPDLLLWVHATLIDTSLLIHDRFFGELDPASRVGYYDETKVIAELMGVPARAIPQTLDAFHAYVEEMLRSDRISLTDEAREIADAVLRPPVPLVAGAAGGAARFATAALLPPRLRRAYGLPWGPRRQAAWRALESAGRISLPAIPRLLREMPQARRPPKLPELPAIPPRIDRSE